jgi:hypothetical protein
MTATLPTGRAGRMLAAWIGGVAPLLHWHAGLVAALGQRRLLAERMAAYADALPALRQAAAVPVAGDVAPALLEGATDAIAGAALQGLVREMTGRVGATLLSVETLPATVGGTHRRIGLRLSLAAPWPVLAHLLDAVDQARPSMLVDDLELHQTQLRVGEAEALLNAAFTVYAFRRDADARGAP